jgi:hypothetical protein
MAIVAEQNGWIDDARLIGIERLLVAQYVQSVSRRAR